MVLSARKKVDAARNTLADYVWLGTLPHRREVTGDTQYVISGVTAKPKFKTEFQRDGLLRLSKVLTEHTASHQAEAGFKDLGTWDYAYDTASNVTSAAMAGSTLLDADREHVYDSLDRLITSRLTDSQVWGSPTQKTSWYDYDDLGNRMSHQYRDAAAIGYAHDKANRMTTLASLTQGYDKAGNVTLAYSADRGTSYQYKWDYLNRLTAVYDDAGTTRKAAFTYDALGRRIDHVNDATGTTRRYYYDGVNQAVEYDQNGNRQNYYVHGLAYVDERLVMVRPEVVNEQSVDRPYYYVIDRMFNVRALIDRAGALVERYCYDSYGRPLIREAPGRGDLDSDGDMDTADANRFNAVYTGSKWDPRADMDDDGDVDAADQTAFNAKKPSWDPTSDPDTEVAQAFSDVDNPFMWQGVPHFALATAASATSGTLLLNEHRLRLTDAVTGRWLSRDPIHYNTPALTPVESPIWFEPQPNAHSSGSGIGGIGGGGAFGGTPPWGIGVPAYAVHALGSLVGHTGLFEYMFSNPHLWIDPSGLHPTDCDKEGPGNDPPPNDGSDYKPDKCRAAAQQALRNCLKAWKEGGSGVRTKDDCFKTFDQLMAACRAGTPGRHNDTVGWPGSDYLDCVGRCIHKTYADVLNAALGWAVPGAPISKKLGGKISRALGGSGRTVGVGGRGVSATTTIPSVMSEVGGFGMRSGLRTMGRIAAPVFVLDSAATAAIEAYCFADCASNPNGKYK